MEQQENTNKAKQQSAIQQLFEYEPYIHIHWAVIFCCNS